MTIIVTILRNICNSFTISHFGIITSNQKKIGLFWSIIDRSFWSFSQSLVIYGVSRRNRWWEVIWVSLHEDFSAWVPLEGPVWESLWIFCDWRLTKDSNYPRFQLLTQLYLPHNLDSYHNYRADWILTYPQPQIVCVSKNGSHFNPMIAGLTGFLPTLSHKLCVWVKMVLTLIPH